MHNDFPYDLESYPNVFSAVIVHAASGTEWIFEVSDRVNQSRQLLNFIRALGQHPSKCLDWFTRSDTSKIHSLPLVAWMITALNTFG